MFKKSHFINITKQPIIVLLAKTSFAFQMRNYSCSRTAPKSLFFIMFKYPLYWSEKYTNGRRGFWFLNLKLPS